MAPKRGEQPDEEFNVPPEVLQQLMAGGGNAGLVQALQRGLANMLGQSSGFIESLPVPVQTRISYLKELDGERAELYERYKEERRALEEKYDALYAPIYAKRSDVINGRQEAPENETEEGKAAAAAEADEVPAGVPDFWMVAIRNALEEDAVNEKDAEVLSYCTDVRCERFHDDETGDEGFKLIFAFKENPFFTDAELWKSYHMGDDEDLMLKKVETSGVNWKSGKDVTVKVLKKKPKPGAKSSGKPQTKTEPVESFFRWFTEVPEVPDEEEAELTQEEMEALEEDMQTDFEVAEMIKEKVIPEATAWFTGEALMEFEGEDDEDDEDEDDEEDEEGEEGDEEDDDDEEEESEGETEATSKRMPAAAKDTKEQPQECKQQ